MNIKKIKTLLSIILLITLLSCGFKIVDQNYLRDYKIAEINISGDDRISYLLRNKLRSSKKSNENLKKIKIEINIDKSKSIKEKNVQNQITKYLIKIKADVNYNVENNVEGNFTIYETGEFSVVSRHTQTLENEKNILKILTLNIEEKIIDNLRISLNDI